MSEKKDVVTRISKKNHDRIKAVTELDKSIALNKRVEKLLDMIDAFQAGEIVYVAGGKVFSDVKDARGEAIMESVKTNLKAEPPRVAVIIGSDQF